ncbi:MAG: cation-translocating P-type ATPase [Anaerolineae bacterium]|nr:cation-translocating P-type ATPase [Anaerolineae bacterium]
MAVETKPNWYAMDVPDVLAKLGVQRATGLTTAQVEQKTQQYGRNVLPTGEGRSWAQLLLSQFTDVMVIVLIIAAIISYLIGDAKDAIIILAIIVLNAALGFYQENQAEQALSALARMQTPHVRVRRNGRVMEIEATALVPGDIVLLEAGNSVPADGRLIEAVNLQVEEAALTGESVAEEKNANTMPMTNPPPGFSDRDNVLYMGTNVTYGRAELVVTETGISTELGKIARMLQQVEQTDTPLQMRLAQLGKILAGAALIIVIIVFLLGVAVRGVPVQEMLLTAIGLAVAAVPEGLPAVITIALSLGARRMVKRNALIRRLPAVETLGSVTTICSDKTGTLTRNEMTVTEIAIPNHEDVKVSGTGYQPVGQFIDEKDQRILNPLADPSLARMLLGSALCTDATLRQDEDTERWQVIGDTTEGALLSMAGKAGYTRPQLEAEAPRVNEIPFTSERKAMTTVHRIDAEYMRPLFENAAYVAFTKGAPDNLLRWAICENTPTGPVNLTEDRRKVWQAQIDQMAAKGLRVLALAYRAFADAPTGNLKPENMERDLSLVGLVGIVDPPRSEATKAVRTAREAGIRTVMITGDHLLTAQAIGGQMGILQPGQQAITGADLDSMSDEDLQAIAPKTAVYARVSPEHKLRVVKALQTHNQIVAMTGDGVNDAPALKQADIGVAMGITGTDVSKGAADMVLTDDNFVSIVNAVEEGRTIYTNIQKFVRYLLSCNTGEIWTLFAALLIGLKVPIVAIQILWVNLVTDGLPAIALGFEPSESGVMKHRPRDPKEGLFANGVGIHILWVGLVIGTLTLIGYVIGHLAIGLSPFNETVGLAAMTLDQLRTIPGLAGVTQTFAQMSPEEQQAVIDIALRIPRTMAFTILAFTQVAEISAIHSGDTSFFKAGFGKNPLLFISCVLIVVLQLALVYIQPLEGLFDTTALPLPLLGVCFGLPLILFILVEIEKWIRRRRDRARIVMAAA